jgi:flagellar basal body-associated protein FliL
MEKRQEPRRSGAMHVMMMVMMMMVLMMVMVLVMMRMMTMMSMMTMSPSASLCYSARAAGPPLLPLSPLLAAPWPPRILKSC